MIFIPVPDDEIIKEHEEGFWSYDHRVVYCFSNSLPKEIDATLIVISVDRLSRQCDFVRSLTSTYPRSGMALRIKMEICDVVMHAMRTFCKVQRLKRNRI
jgi:hypothetical protein